MEHHTFFEFEVDIVQFVRKKIQVQIEDGVFWNHSGRFAYQILFSFDANHFSHQPFFHSWLDIVADITGKIRKFPDFSEISGVRWVE